MKLKSIPTFSTDLIKALDESFPAECIKPGQSLEDAHRYAGKRELVETLLHKLKKQSAMDLEGKDAQTIIATADSTSG